MGFADAIKNTIIMAGANAIDKQVDGTKIATDLKVIAAAKFGQKAVRSVSEGPLSNILHEIKVGLWEDKNALAAHYRRLALTLEQTSTQTGKK